MNVIYIHCILYNIIIDMIINLELHQVLFKVESGYHN